MYDFKSKDVETWTQTSYVLVEPEDRKMKDVPWEIGTLVRGNDNWVGSSHSKEWTAIQSAPVVGYCNSGYSHIYVLQIGARHIAVSWHWLELDPEPDPKEIEKTLRKIKELTNVQ